MLPNPTPPPSPAGAARQRVYLVEDHPVVRDGLAQLINEEDDLVICGAAADAPTALREIQDAAPDVAVVDLLLGEADGLELVRTLKARLPRMPTLVLSMYNESLYAERALRAGSRGYIMKEEAIEQVLVAIRRALAGEIFLSDRMKSKMIQQMASGRGKVVASPIEQLTDRELEVFRLIGEGCSTRQIAGQLHLSIRTVEAYREYIKAKLGLKNATELVQHAFHWVHYEAAA